MSSSRIKRPGFGLPVNNDALGGFPQALLGWQGTPITIHERTMMALMDSITDKPEWERKIFDESVNQKWRQEALKSNDIDVSEKMFDWIVAELQDKAESYRKDGMVCVHDLDVAVVKSDTAVPTQLLEDLREACKPLENVSSKLKDWHPGSDEKVLDLVHPSLFPLIFGRSKVLGTTNVGLMDCTDHIGQGETIKIPDDYEIRRMSYSGYYGGTPPKFWSKEFQWLPCQVSFGDHDDVSVISYINNLHPIHHPQLYSVIERCIAKAISLWNRCLSPKHLRHREPRIDMGVTKYDFPQGQAPPSNHMRPDADTDGSDEGDNEYERHEAWEKATRVLLHPDPDEYRNWDGPDRNQIDLRNQFKESGLQVIVKLANIQLTPEKPEYGGGSWHIEGQLNERICASALLYYDSENITESYLAFRQAVNGEELTMKAYDQDDYEGCEIIYGIKQHEPQLQELGRVSTKQGRLITFPNVLQHRVSPFRLQDPSKPGHRKLLALFLVDPYIPILSTANVPPQQQDWWSERIQQDQSLVRLPAELSAQIFQEVSEMPISLKEAKEIRLRLMDERKAYVKDVEYEMQSHTFNFCEH
ncbi:hypothetical protein ACLMJK_000045 [Lecanora helva]